MAFSPSLFASANPSTLSPNKESRNLWRNKLTQVGTLPATKTDRLSPTTLQNNYSPTEDTECMVRVIQLPYFLFPFRFFLLNKYLKYS